jgi:hypothetical protein
LATNNYSIEKSGDPHLSHTGEEGLREVANAVTRALSSIYVPTKKEVKAGIKTYDNMTVQDVILSKAAQKAAESGDFNTLDKMLSRQVGRPISLSIAKGGEGGPGLEAYLREESRKKEARERMNQEL